MGGGEDGERGEERMREEREERGERGEDAEEDRGEDRRGEDGTICHMSAFGFVDPIGFWGETARALNPKTLNSSSRGPGVGYNPKPLILNPRVWE